MIPRTRTGLTLPAVIASLGAALLSAGVASAGSCTWNASLKETMASACSTEQVATASMQECGPSQAKACPVMTMAHQLAANPLDTIAPFLVATDAMNDAPKSNAYKSDKSYQSGKADRASAASAAQCPYDARTVGEWLSESPKFSKLWRAVQASGMEHKLASKEFTLYAPTNDAFDRLPDGELDRLLRPENRSELKALIKNHLVARSMSCEVACDTGAIETIAGYSLAMAERDGSAMVGGAKVLLADIPAENGKIHVIDRVLLPPG